VSDEPVIDVIERRVRRACYLALVALALIVWSLLHPKPLPVIVAMSVGQGIGTLSLLMFIHAIIADVRKGLSQEGGKDS
jgi:hypothetical protein